MRRTGVSFLRFGRILRFEPLLALIGCFIIPWGGVCHCRAFRPARSFDAGLFAANYSGARSRRPVYFCRAIFAGESGTHSWMDFSGVSGSRLRSFLGRGSHLYWRSYFLRCNVFEHPVSGRRCIAGDEKQACHAYFSSTGYPTNNECSAAADFLSNDSRTQLRAGTVRHSVAPLHAGYCVGSAVTHRAVLFLFRQLGSAVENQLTTELLSRYVGLFA